MLLVSLFAKWGHLCRSGRALTPGAMSNVGEYVGGLELHGRWIPYTPVHSSDQHMQLQQRTDQVTKAVLFHDWVCHCQGQNEPGNLEMSLVGTLKEVGTKHVICCSHVDMP